MDMSDARTPQELGEALAEAMLTKHPAFATPQEFIVSSNFKGFCDGRSFNDEQRIACEKAYQLRYRELTQ
jgi:hypothetical protein